MADYLTNTTDLTTVADAIRTRGGTSDTLTFPDGFAEAIEDIPSSAVVQALSVTENGTYTAPSGVDGYSPVTVNVSGGGGSIQHISSNNTRPYINTGIIPTVNTRVRMEVTNVNSTAYFFGCWAYNYDRGAFAIGNDTSVMYLGYDGQGGSLVSSIVPYDTSTHIVELNKNVAYIDGSVAYTFTVASSIGNTTYPIYLFCQNRIGIASWQQTSYVAEETFSLISCKIWENDTLVRDFVPVKDGNGVVCLLERVNALYYYPKQGTFTEPT